MIMIFGPYHEAKELRSLLNEDYQKLGVYQNLNIICLMVKKNESKFRILTQHNTSHRIASQEAAKDGFSRSLGRLCKLTQEGYMMSIDQKIFEGRDTYFEDNEDKNQSLALNKLESDNYPDQHSVLSPRTELVSHIKTKTVKNNVSNQIQGIFERITESIELYSTDKIPIVTEFLEF